MAKEPKGVQLLSITPLNKDYTVNEDAIFKQVEWAIREGASGIWTLGFIGECSSTDEEMKKKILKAFIDAAKGRLFMAAGCWGLNPFQSIRLVNYAQKLGYDLAWMGPPVPRRASDDELFEFYKTVHDNTSMPLGMYSTVAFGVYYKPTLTARIADLDRMTCMKEVIADFDHIAMLYKLGVYEKIKVFPTHAGALQLLLGAAGLMSVPPALKNDVKVYNTFMKGDIVEALKIDIDGHGWLLAHPGSAALAFGANIEQSTHGWTKAVSGELMGIELGPPMPPYLAASEKQKEAIREMLKRNERPTYHPQVKR